MYKINKNSIQNARLNAGLGITEVANKTGIPRVTIYRLENGLTIKPRADTLQKLATVYNKRVTDFIEGGDA